MTELQQPSSSSSSHEATTQVCLLKVRRHQGGIFLAWTPIRWQCPEGCQVLQRQCLAGMVLVPVPCPALPCPAQTSPGKR